MVRLTLCNFGAWDAWDAWVARDAAGCCPVFCAEDVRPGCDDCVDGAALRTRCWVPADDPAAEEPADWEGPEPTDAPGVVARSRGDAIAISQL